MERDGYAAGTPCWIDLGSPDLDGTAAFYGGLFGWECRSAGPEELTGGYRTFFLRDLQVAGLGPQQSPGPPYWASYVAVDDADETVALVTSAGGTVFVPPMDVMDLGRMAVFADPTGAVLSVWQPGAHRGAQLVNEPGTLVWNELSTRDVPAARAFYTSIFPWTVDDKNGEYTEWQVDGASVGGMMETPAMVPAEVPAHWLVYFAVDDVEATGARAVELGATVLVPPTDTPAGRFTTVLDPQGAMFAMITMEHEASL